MSPSRQQTSKKKLNILALKKVEHVYSILREFHPNAEIELNFENHYQLLVAVVLSAQATDISVNLVTEKLFKVVKQPADLLVLEYEALEEIIRSIGLWKSKAKNLRLMSEQLIEKHQGIVPSSLKELEALAGVGRKTASVILNVAFNKPIIAVDTHVYRVSGRIGLRPEGLSIDKVADYLNEKTPKDFLIDAHHLLIFHGRYICKARKPMCDQCPVSQCCQYFEALIDNS